MDRIVHESNKIINDRCFVSGTKHRCQDDWIYYFLMCESTGNIVIEINITISM